MTVIFIQNAIPLTTK